jgi:hypothetical protein
MKRIVLVILLVFLVLGVGGVGWGGEPFVVLGKSEQGEAVQSPTLEMAIQDGLTRAVEEAVRGMVASQTMQKSKRTLSQEFYQKADAFVLSYKILEKTVLPTGYQALLEVVVDTKKIEGRLASLGLAKNRGGYPTLRTAHVVVSGIRSYQIYLQIEQLLREDAGVQAFSLSEIEPTKFTWKVTMKGEIGRLANKLLYHDFGGLRGRVVALHPNRLEVVLSR